MKHHLLSAIIMALCLVPSIAQAQIGIYDFSAVNSDGVTIYYKILSEEEKTCEISFNWDIIVWHGETYFENEYYSGCLNIPAFANGYKVVSIGDWAFSGCYLVNSVKFPNTLTTIKDEAFENCRGLTSVIIPNSVTIIGNAVFSGCSLLTSVTIPNSVTTIGNAVFSGCSLLTSVTIPNSVTTIGNMPFYNCPSLESIIVEDGNPSFNSLGNCNAIIETNSGTLIYGCKKTIITELVKSIGDYAFEGCSGLTSIEIPNSVNSIGNGAFYCCGGLTSITIPSSVTSIGGGAFNGCKSLYSITIPISVTYIGGSAFANCTNLSTVYSEITDFFDIDKSVFKGSENTTLYVPKGMATTYRSSTGWSVIKFIEEMPDDTPDASFLISCSNRGSVSINGAPSITNKIAAADINEGTDNTFTFTPKPGCRLDQVILNGLDITANVVNNTLTCTIPANSQMIVTFTTEQGDINNDGRIDITDIVTIVNKILSIQ